MTNEQVAVKITDLERRMEGVEHRVKDCEKTSAEMTDLVISINKLANSMENMVGEQKRQGELLNQQSERLTVLEEAPLREFTYYKRIVIGCVLTGIVSFILGNFCSLL